MTKPVAIDFSKPGPVTIGTETLSVGSRFNFQGDLAEFYSCTYERPLASTKSHGGTRFDRMLEDDVDVTNAVLKVVADTLDNDLAENEVKILHHLFPPKTADEKFFRYLPQPLMSFRVLSGGQERQALLMPFMEGYVSMAEVHRAFPDGLDFRDVVWMFKRLLVGIGFAHTRGVVHGAVLPTHVLVHPVGHGAKIIDWSYAIEGEGRIRAMSTAFQDFYASEILEKKPATPSTDIFMAAKCAVQLLGGDIKTNKMPDKVPAEIRSFLDECLVPLPNMRPRNAWDLHEAFDQLLLKLVGKPSYRLLNMPARTP